MPIQIATTSALDEAQRIVIAEVRYTAEHSAPCPNLVEKFILNEGEKQITVPKVAQMTADDLVDGQDITTSKAIGMTTTDLTTGEVGLKCILSDKLLRQSQPDLFRVIGRQMGDLAESAMKRAFKIKDVSQLLPGHGGFMDRIDGLVPVAVVLAVVVLFLDPQAPAGALLSGLARGTP